MNAQFCWFSGTGNSLWAAKQLAAHLDNAKLTPMARCLNGSGIPDGDPLILVFPVYNHLIPWLVQRFVDRLPAPEGRTLFAVCTYGDSPGISLEYLQKRMAEKGGSLAGGFGVRMPYNYISPSKSLRSVFQPFRLREIPANVQQQLFTDAAAKLQTIADAVRTGKHGILETEYVGIEHAVDRLNLRNTLQKNVWLRKAGYRGKTNRTSVESVQFMDVGFWTTNACTGCQTCVRVCPVHNIRFIGGRPAWQRQCEQCFACLQWCPAQAVQFREGTPGGKRYHNPMISLNEIMMQPTEED